MKKSFFRISVSAIALVIGLLSVWCFSFYNFQTINSQTEVKSSENLLKNETANDSIEPIKKEKFTFSSPFGGSDGSYGALYNSSDGQIVSNELNCWKNISATKESLKSQLVIAKETISKSKIKDTERSIIRIGDKGLKFIEIYKYDGGKCFARISAPNLELALDFEEWLKTQK